MLDGCTDRSCGVERRSSLSKVWVELLKLADLRLRAPARVAIPCFRQVGQNDRANASRLIKSCCALRRDRFDLRESGFLRQPYRFFVQLFRLKLTTFNTRKLGCDQLMPGSEISRAAIGPRHATFDVVREGKWRVVLDLRLVTCDRQRHGQAQHKIGIRRTPNRLWRTTSAFQRIERELRRYRSVQQEPQAELAQRNRRRSLMALLWPRARSPWDLKIVPASRPIRLSARARCVARHSEFSLMPNASANVRACSAYEKTLERLTAEEIHRQQPAMRIRRESQVSSRQTDFKGALNE